MARFRPEARGGLRREALMPLRSTSSLSVLAIVATCVILLAAAVDAFFWNQGAERRELQNQVREAELESELLRFENERLRRRLLDAELVPSPRAQRTQPVCNPADPLCGI